MRPIQASYEYHGTAPFYVLETDLLIHEKVLALLFHSVPMHASSGPARRQEYKTLLL